MQNNILHKIHNYCVQDIQECGEPQGDGDHAVQPHLQGQPEESPPAAEPRAVTGRCLDSHVTRVIILV